MFCLSTPPPFLVSCEELDESKVDHMWASSSADVASANDRRGSLESSPQPLGLVYSGYGVPALRFSFFAPQALRSGAQRLHHRKKRKVELGRQSATTNSRAKRIHAIRTRGGNTKYRALRLRLVHGNFTWASENVTIKTRLIGVMRNPRFATPLRWLADSISGAVF